MALHEQSVGKTDEWYTPPHVFGAMAVRFDMDAASPGAEIVPWIPADRHFVADSLREHWSGFVWMNAPFGGRNGLRPWLAKFFAHGNGVALVPDRTSAPWWQEFAPRADLMLAVAKKIRFIDAQGKTGDSPAQGTALLALGSSGIGALRNAHGAGLGSLWLPALGNDPHGDKTGQGSPSCAPDVSGSPGRPT